MSNRNRNRAASADAVDTDVIAPNADAPAADQPVDENGNAPAPADAPAADASKPADLTPIDMQTFAELPDRANWKSIRDTAKLIYGDAYEAKNDQTIRNAARGNAIFAGTDARVLVLVDGYEIPPLTYLHIDAVQRYIAAQSSTATTGRTHGGPKRMIVRISDVDMAAYAAGTLALTSDRFPLEAVQSGPKKAKATDVPADGAVSSDVPPADLTSADAVDAVDTSTPADTGAHEVTDASSTHDVITNAELPADLAPVNADWSAPAADQSAS